MAMGLVLIAAVMIIDVNLWWLVPAFIVYGLGNAFVWSPNSTSTMRDLPLHHMGVGSGVYNTTRQIGCVIGSAAIGAVLQWRIMAGDMGAAYGQSIILGAVMLAVGFVSAMLAQDKPRR